MAKGNRTGSRRETAHLQANNERFRQEINTYKQYAENRRRSRTYKQEQMTVLYESLCEYIKQRQEQEKPLTVAGAILATGIDDTMWYSMRNGDLDYRLDEFLDLHGISLDDAPVDEAGMKYCIVDGEKVLLIEFSALIKRYMLLLQAQAEERLYSKSGKVTDIFALKALHGWQDSSQQTVYDNRTLNLNMVAPLEEAQAAMKRLID